MFEDQSRPVRAGEELDVGKLAAYLRSQVNLPDAPVEVAQFPSGHSNLTYLVRVGDREFALRRPPFGSKVKSAHDMGREVRVLSQLAPHYGKAPRVVLACDDASILGAPFYLMQRLRGVILRREVPRELVIDAALARRISTALVDTLVELHALDPAALGLGDFGKPEGYVERQVSGWTKRYLDAQTDEIPDVTQVAAWLAAHQPTSPRATLIHNDFKLDNVVLDPGDLGRIIGVLDWEMATLGDPLMDLGTMLCYWIEWADSDRMRMIRMGPTHLSGMFSRREIVDRYAERTGRDTRAIVFYYAFGLFKTAVVAQQIYLRFHKGLTRDDRFGQMIFAVRVLAEQAAQVIAKNSI